jgi:hypothetical protein
MNDFTCKPLLAFRYLIQYIKASPGLRSPEEEGHCSSLYLVVPYPTCLELTLHDSLPIS